MSSISRIEFAPDLTEQVYQRLLNAICDGELAPAARLTQEELAAALTVSRQPVPQALRLLKRDGFVIDADMKFHHMIYAASGNPLIAETANHHGRHIRRAMGAVLQTVGVRSVVWDEHEAILQAINFGDADRAERLAREHGERAGHNLAAQLTQDMRSLPERTASQQETP